MTDQVNLKAAKVLSSEDRKSLLRVALRYGALLVDIEPEEIKMDAGISKEVSAFLLSLSEKGYVADEKLLRALCSLPATEDLLNEITEVIDSALGIGLNWVPLVKGWDVPTGESFLDHCITFYANFFQGSMSGTTLPCGHLIPDGTFPLERYNGCPFCGTPFKTSDVIFTGQGTKKKELGLKTLQDLESLQHSFLKSTVPLDATQIASLKDLTEVFGVDDSVFIAMKETRMVVSDALLAKAFASGSDDLTMKAGAYFTSPADILRYLWYKKTGKLQVIEPKTLIAHAGKLNAHMWGPLDRSQEAKDVMKTNLKLSYSRRMCRAVALWLNSLDMDADQACEIMHPKRGMWVRMIRALRLGEYSRKPGFEKLRELLDVFYKDEYSVWKGELDRCLGITCGCVDYNRAMELLKQRPGTFARSLFAVMLRMGPQVALDAFREVMDKVPSRLILSLGNAAESFFNPSVTRIARPITGVTKVIPYNRRLGNYTASQRSQMAQSVADLYKEAMQKRFSQEQFTPGRKIYIDPGLFDIPVSIGDRSSTIQDTSAALQGTRFKVEGDAVRLFMQWGKGLPAQHLDMDLSAAVCYQDGRKEYCGYFNLTLPGAKHSGDIRNIPDQIGTAEYVELNLPELKSSGAKYVMFSCNAYSHGAISPNLMVGWMNSASPMALSDETGVAYDPSTVQHIVRISEGNLSKGLIFGVLDVDKAEITWLEMSFNAQYVAQLNSAAVEALLNRLRNKLSVGQLLSMKAEVQQCVQVSSPEEADKDLCYTYQWALDASSVSQLLF